MPEHLRSLIVILALSTIVFVLARRSACSIMETEDFSRRRNVWFALTLAGFFAQSFWIYVAVASLLLLLYASRRESNPAALFFFVLFVLPIAPVQIPGLGLINFFFDLSHARLLELLILLPAFVSLMQRADSLQFGRNWPDRALAGFLLFTAALYLRDPNPTNFMRQVFYLFIDVFLPYFVISRSLKELQTFRDVLLSLVLAVMVIAVLAVFETSKGWLLYSAITDVLLAPGGLTDYLARDGMLRALVTAGQPIALGYLMLIGVGIYLFVQRSIKGTLPRRLGMALLTAGLIAPLSRGPWLGAAALWVVYIATGRHAARHLMGLALATALALPLVAVLPGGEKVINLLPFIGTTEKDNIDYREKLLTNSMIVIQRNPWFGSMDYLKAPEMESMRQGQGIIDVVNTYLQVALGTGLITLGLFVAFFALTLQGIYRALRSVPNRDSEEYLLGRVLLATLVAMLITMVTVASITIIPMMYWSVAGLGVAYAQMVRRNAVPNNQGGPN